MFSHFNSLSCLTNLLIFFYLIFNQSIYIYIYIYICEISLITYLIVVNMVQGCLLH
jgi:hypothetical protein